MLNNSLQAMKAILIASVILVLVMVVRGVTYALTHAVGATRLPF